MELHYSNATIPWKASLPWFWNDLIKGGIWCICCNAVEGRYLEAGDLYFAKSYELCLLTQGLVGALSSGGLDGDYFWECCSVLDAKISQLVRGYIEAEWIQRGRDLKAAIVAVKSEHARRGTLRSSMLIQQVQSLCAEELKARARLAWGRLKDTHRSLGSPQSETLAEDLKREVQIYIDSQDQHLKQIASTEAGGIKGMPPIDSLSGEKAYIERSLTAEIDLYVAELPHENGKHQGGAVTTINITGPIGSVQTGPGSVANVTQFINGADKETLLVALREVKALLEKIDDAAAPEKQDVLQVVSDAETELTKETPNNTKLRGLLMGAAITIQTIPAMQPAYQAIKAAMLQIGFHLP